MRIIGREDQQLRERDMLGDDAMLSSESEGRDRSSASDILRNDFQRDRDKILHSKAFRRLSHKTQVFLAVEGDHYRTRLTHTLEVSQISRTIARALSLNEDLTEAIALGHDLGHTPFGHAGEAALSDCLARREGFELDGPSFAGSGDRSHLLFHHNRQSLRVVEVIENGGAGLNLTAEVRDGIVCHSGNLRAETLEGRVVAISDRIAYVNHDIDDAIRAGLLSEDDLPESTHAVIGGDHSARIESLVLDLVETSATFGDIRMSDPMWSAMMELRSFLFDSVYTSSAVKTEADKASRLIGLLFQHYVDHPDEVPGEYRDIARGDAVVAAVDYIAGMTDRFARDSFHDFFSPRSLRANELAS